MNSQPSTVNRARSGFRLALLLLAVLGCSHRPVRLVVVTSSVAQTVSLLGDTLYNIPLDPGGGPARVARISAAREELAQDSSDIRRWLRLARSTVAIGRLRDAVTIYTRMAELDFVDPRPYRERGEVLLRLHHLDAAINDLRKAGLLIIGKGAMLEPRPEANQSPTGQVTWSDLTTLQYQIPLLLGVALYCKGDNRAASEVLAEAVKAALTADELSHAMLWLFFAVRRLGDGSGANDVLGLVKPDWADGTRHPHINLLLAYKGVIPSDTIQARALSHQGDERALYSYGIGYFLQLLPERLPDAELWLQRARLGGNWSTLPYIAAEADLARLRGVAARRQPIIVRPQPEQRER